MALTDAYNSLSPMMSYAQQGEDVILRRAFQDVTEGFYVDVGAAWPVEHSVTKYFSTQGWAGINIEPNPEVFAALQADRPRDINLNLAVAPKVGRTTLAVYPGATGWSTIATDIKERHQGIRLEAKEYEVETKPLDAILAEYAPDKKIHFIKIDVEGTEKGVLESVDLSHWNPGVVVVEATEPGSPQQSHHEWESLLTDRGYAMRLFDGLNRWYSQDPAIGERISVPPNSFDKFVPFTWWRLLDRAVQEQLKAKYGFDDSVPMNGPGVVPEIG